MQPQEGHAALAGAAVPVPLASHAQLLADAQMARQQKKLWSRVLPCAAESEKVSQKWVHEVDAADHQVPGFGLEVVLATAKGEMKQPLLRLLEAHALGRPPWVEIRLNLVHQFVTADKEQRAFTEMMGMRRFADESIAVFWRRFQVTLREAIPELGQADLRRSVIPALAQAIGNDKLARRLFGLREPTLPLLRETMDSFIAVEEQMVGLKSKTRRAAAGWPSPTVNQVSEGMETLTTAVEKIMTRLAKLEAKEKPHGGTPKKGNGFGKKKIMCYACGKLGHMRRECKAHSGDSQAPGAQSHQ